MEEIEEISDALKDKRSTNIDVDFCSFYYEAVKRLLDIDSATNVSYLYRYERILKKYYDIFCQVKLDLEKQEKTVLKLIESPIESSLYYRFIYFYRNATLFSSAAAFHFQNVYTQNPEIIERLLTKKVVKICSIGGCSVPGIVAVVMVLRSIALKMGLEIELRVTIIDKNAEWRNACITVLSCLQEFHEATWKINFIQCDFAKIKTWTPEMLKTIEESDVITMVRFMSNLEVKRNIVQMISDRIKTEGILLILDRPYAKFINLYFDITNLGNFHLIHTELCDYHTLDIEAVKQFRTLYKKHFGDEKQLVCSVSCNMFVSVWMKALSETDTQYKDNVECIFLRNTEKYDSKLKFLRYKALNNWETLFKRKKEVAGWNPKDIKKVTKQQKEKKHNMIGKYIAQKREVDSLQNYLLTQIQCVANDGNEFRETNSMLLRKYLNKKSQHSLMKKEAYFSSLSALNICCFLD